MNKIIKKIALCSLIVGLVFGGYKLIKFNQYRYTVISNSGSLPFRNNMNLLHIYPNLQSIWITSYDEDTEIEGLDSLENLKELTFAGASFNKIEGLDNLHNLEYLSFRLNKIEKIEGLSGLNHLQNLDLSFNQITTIENIEEIPLLKNDYCYTFEIPEEEISSYTATSKEEDGTYIAEDCFVEKEPDDYIDKDLYNDNFEYGEMISPLSKTSRGGNWTVTGNITLIGNPITSITQESYDYIKKYRIGIVFDEPLSSLEII